MGAFWGIDACQSDADLVLVSLVLESEILAMVTVTAYHVRFYPSGPFR